MRRPQAAVLQGTAHSSVAELRDRLQQEVAWRTGLEQQNRELIGRTETQELELVQNRSTDMTRRDTRVGTLTHELNVLRADHSTITAEIRSADAARTSTVNLRTKLLDSEARERRETERLRTFEAELRAAKYDCEHLRSELKEWEDQAQGQHQQADQSRLPRPKSVFDFVCDKGRPSIGAQKSCNLSRGNLQTSSRSR